jgi:hypothetical protein
MKLLDVVALLENLPELGLHRGQVGTIVEEYEPNIFEVEFSDTEGRAYALETLQASQLMVLYYQPVGERTLVDGFITNQQNSQSRMTASL